MLIIFLWGGKLACALMVMLFDFGFCSLCSGVRSESEIFVSRTLSVPSYLYLKGRHSTCSAQWVAMVGKGRCSRSFWISLPFRCLCPWVFGLLYQTHLIFPDNLKVLGSEALGLEASYIVKLFYTVKLFCILNSSHLAQSQFRHHMQVSWSCLLSWWDMCLDLKFCANQKSNLGGKICHLHWWITISECLLLEVHCQLRTDCILCNLSLCAPECSKYELFAVPVCCMLLC